MVMVTALCNGLWSTRYAISVSGCCLSHCAAQHSADNCSRRSKNRAHPRCQNLPLSASWVCKQTVNTLPYSQAPSRSARYSLNCNCNFVALLILLLLFVLVAAFVLWLLLLCCCCSAAAAFDATAGSKFPLNVHFCTSFWIKLFALAVAQLNSVQPRAGCSFLWCLC